MKLSLKRADELMERLLQIPEPRNAKGIRHQKISVTAIAVCAIMSNAGSFAAIAEWAARCSQNDYPDFPYVGQVLCIRRESIYLKTGRKTKETVCGITSLSPEKAGPARLLQLNRGHRGIENRLHYVRDVTFDEDRCQIRTKNAPQVMASIRNFVIGLFRCFGKINIAQSLALGFDVSVAGSPERLT